MDGRVLVEINEAQSRFVLRFGKHVGELFKRDLSVHKQGKEPVAEFN